MHKALKEKLRVMKREMEKEEGLVGNKEIE